MMIFLEFWCMMRTAVVFSSNDLHELENYLPELIS